VQRAELAELPLELNWRRRPPQSREKAQAALSQEFRFLLEQPRVNLGIAKTVSHLLAYAT
jgi:hypothetical protein